MVALERAWPYRGRTPSPCGRSGWSPPRSAGERRGRCREVADGWVVERGASFVCGQRACVGGQSFSSLLGMHGNAALDRCAVLLHSSDRLAARPFWRPLALSIDRHFPAGICDAYFSYESADDAAAQAIAGLNFTLLRRGNSNEWVSSLRTDLDLLQAYRWIFHLCDDALIPDPISHLSISAVLDVAQRHNASLISLYRRSHGFWSMNGRFPDLTRQYTVTLRPVAPGRQVELHFFSPHFSRSQMVVHQNFALWQRQDLQWALSLVPPSTSPTSWERAFDPQHFGRRYVYNSSLSRALVVRYVGGADGMQGVEDTAHNGSLKQGWAACAWLRAASRLGLRIEMLPGGASFASDPGYSFCQLAGAVGVGLWLLHATPGCTCGRVHGDRQTVSCGCRS